MKTIGLIGGTTWISTVDYYRIINEKTTERLGGLNSAKLYMYSLNFEEFKPSADPEQWKRIAASFITIANKLATAGAECILLCANTPHMVAGEVSKNIKIPLIHIAEETAKEIKKQQLKKVGLLGTKFTMEQNFFKDKLSDQSIETIIPEEEERVYIHDSIFNELNRGIFKPETKQKYLAIIDKLISNGAEGIILGCTEIPLLIKPSECSVPVFDTTLIHATAAVDFALR